jgi:hypothetical protein
MKTIEDLQAELSEAEFEVSRSLAMIDTHKQQFCMGEDLHRGMLFRDNLRLHCAQSALSKIEKAIRKIETQPLAAVPKRQKHVEPTPEQTIELKQLKLDAQKLHYQNEQSSRQAKIAIVELSNTRERVLVQKMREIIGEETFTKICAELSAE